MTVGPRKYMIRELLSVQPPVEVWIQGTIEQTVGTDILIIADGSGRAKVTKCDSADGVIDKSSLRKGTYCCIIGTAVKTKGLPEVQASKFLDLSSQPQMKDAWESEVREVNLFLQGKVLPSI
ncbi:recQ-mediated genome instability protein 2 domain-containing protein [Phthorimaea operculella]|nr:recQ-mediated genome instability protein 2 domain-containing protein [Phthorimaea operculella]